MRWVRGTGGLVAAVAMVVMLAGTAVADVPVGSARYVPCPPPTGDASRYVGAAAPFRCHSAVADPLGNTVVLRQGRSDAGPSAFGMLHALVDHNVEDHVIERVVSTAFPLTAPRGRVRYIAEFRVEGQGTMSVWVEADPRPSNQAPDDQRFGVVTAYCKVPLSANPENKCPDWVNDTLP
ncbi:hypothetical protein ACQPX6_29535 [Actinomycetospora sp. CA-101289]|uniref:hypothetical protein n=1 Tax=Actinomycetospora sp. CA-101289 TaxID=3239893 RepID=UPI003D963909